MEMIIRIKSKDQDVEVLYNNLIDDEITEKKLSYKKFMEIFTNQASNKNDEDINAKYLGSNVIGYAETARNSKYLINQPENKRFITWDVAGSASAAQINFPNSIYEVIIRNNQIQHIKAYMYLNWNGKDTALYKYAMPNMLSENNICIGSANRTFDDDILQSLENIIYAPYSHSQLNNVKGFATTKSYFEYLKNNKIEEKHLYPTKLKIKDIVS